MRILSFPCILLGVMVTLPSCSSPPTQSQEVPSSLARELAPQVADSDLAELAAGNGRFAFALYRELAVGEGNLFYSPYSISTALAMTYAGAKNRTADQMAQVLQYTLPQEHLHPAFNKLALELASRAEAEGVKPGQAFQLSVANSLWGQIGFHFEQDFLDLLARNYAAGMRLADFQRDPEAARVQINDWVYRGTREKIKDIIPKGPPDLIDEMTRLVLADAVYFRAAWAQPFVPEATSPAAFRLSDGSTVEAPTMHKTAALRSMEGGGFRMVELPYVGGEVSMLILLPNAGNFAEIEFRLDTELVNAAVAGLQGGEIALALPKFQFDWAAANLPEALQSLGMTDAFSMEADFSGMDGKLDLFLSAVLHKAFVSVDEAGTEAAASTVAIIAPKALPMEIVDFTVDRPFIFLIRDNPTGTILFLGRVMNPTA
jgi:serpin B